MSPVDHADLHARLGPDRPAAHDLTTGRRWTYREFDAAISRCAGYLADVLGLAPGERVASLARNRAELVILHLACARAGLIYAPLNWRLSPSEISDLLIQAEPAVLIGDSELDRAGIVGEDLDAFFDRADVAARLAYRAIDQDAVSLILFTSGTSGQPKGVMLSERALTETAINFGVLGAVNRDSAFLIDAPMFHVIGLVTSVRPGLMQGATLVVSDGFDPARTLARLGDPDLGISHYFCVPQMAERLLSHPEFIPGALSGLTAVFTGGAPHPAASIHAWLDVGIPIVDGFGMSEAGTVFGMPADPDIIRAKAGSVGVPTGTVSVRLVDGNDQDVEVGQAGELLLKGANLFCGYWRRAEETAKAFTGDGWFRTGDIAVCDADGYFTIVDRKKDMFISGGENIYPAEIEAALAGFPGLTEAAVVGVPDERWGEVGLCVLVGAGPSEGLIDAVTLHLSARLASYKQPRHFVLLDRLPRTGSGKVRKSDLRAQFTAETAGA